MKLIVLTGLPIKEKALLTRDLANHYLSQGQRVAVMDNANTAEDLADIQDQLQLFTLRGGCVCCSVADKLYRTTAKLGHDVDIVILPVNNQTHVDSLDTILHNLIAGSSIPIELNTIALVDDRTLCCFPYVAETLQSYASATLTAPFSLKSALTALEA